MTCGMLQAWVGSLNYTQGGGGPGRQKMNVWKLSGFFIFNEKVYLKFISSLSVV